MKRVWMAIAVCALLPAGATAAPCVTGSLASYVALGAGGCTVGDALFFDFASLPLQSGAAAVTDSGNFVSPVGGAGNPGLRFAVEQAADTTELFQSVIGYKVSAASLVGNSVAIAASSALGDGAVTAVENMCLGGTFAADLVTCSGTPATLIAFDAGFDASLLEVFAFAPATLIGIISDITIDGGLTGSASVRSVAHQFTTQQVTAVPEPSTLVLLGTGALAVARRRRHAQPR